MARRKRLALAAVFVFALYIFGLGATNFLSAQASAAAPRDEETGVMTGCEPYTLGDKDSDVAVLFVHGFIGTPDNFGPTPQRLADHGAYVDVMLLPGHGTRARDMKTVTGDELVEAVVEKVRALRKNHKKVILVGHSMGGTLSTLAAAEEPVDGLVLGAPYFGVTRKWYYGLKPETWSKITSPVVPWIYKGEVFKQVNDKSQRANITTYRWIPSKATVMLGKLGKRVNAPETLDAIHCPVLVLHSKADIAASPAQAEAALNRMATEDKELVWLPRSSHIIFWDYDRETVAEETLAFIKRIT